MLTVQRGFATLSLLTVLRGFATLTALFCFQQLSAQLPFADYQTVKHSDSWLTGSNAAGLMRYTDRNIAEAETSITKQEGALTDIYESESVTLANARVESFFRLSPRTVLFGSMGYSSYSGKDMTGSAFIQSRHLPFDIVEDSLTNPGDKHRDTYCLSGAAGISLTKHLSVGLRADYTSANYAKYKDLRHKNKYMDLTVSPGISYQMVNGQWSMVNGHKGLVVFTIGANYIYRRNTESLHFSTYGKNEKVYKSFVNYGPFVGRVEQFGTTGFTDKSHEMPLVDDYNGLSLQVSLDKATSPQCLAVLPQGHLLFASFTYAHRRGYYGSKSPYTITHTNHSSDILSLDAAIGPFQIAKQMEIGLDIHANSENLVNYGSTYREQTNDAGAYYYQYFTPVKTANRLWRDFNAAITANIGSITPHPSEGRDRGGVSHASWVLQAAFSRNNRKQTAYLYPYYRTQDLTTTAITFAATHHIATARTLWSLSLTGSYRKGSGEPYKDYSFYPAPSDLPLELSSHATEGTQESDIPSLPALLYREYQYLTSPQYAVGGTVRYAFSLSKSFTPYILFNVMHQKANHKTGDYEECIINSEYNNGKYRTSATLAIGCNF